MANPNNGVCLKDPNFAVICSFMDKYAEILGLPEIGYQDLQNWIEDTKYVHPLLIELHVRMLRRIHKKLSNTTSDRWEKGIVKFCHKYSDVDAWEIERFGYKIAKVSTKLTLLKNLMEGQFDCNSKFKEKLTEIQNEDMRVYPVGRDKNGMAYWYMLDKELNLRVYRENQDDVDSESWELVCRTRDELANLISSLENGVDIRPAKTEASDLSDGSFKSEPVSDLNEDSRDSFRQKTPIGPSPLTIKQEADDQEGDPRDEGKDSNRSSIRLKITKSASGSISASPSKRLKEKFEKENGSKIKKIKCKLKEEEDVEEVGIKGDGDKSGSDEVDGGGMEVDEKESKDLEISKRVIVDKNEDVDNKMEKEEIEIRDCSNITKIVPDDKHSMSEKPADCEKSDTSVSSEKGNMQSFVQTENVNEKEDTVKEMNTHKTDENAAFDSGDINRDIEKISNSDESGNKLSVDNKPETESLKEEENLSAENDKKSSADDNTETLPKPEKVNESDQNNINKAVDESKGMSDDTSQIIEKDVSCESDSKTDESIPMGGLDKNIENEVSNLQKDIKLENINCNKDILSSGDLKDTETSNVQDVGLLKSSSSNKISPFKDESLNSLESDKSKVNEVTSNKICDNVSETKEEPLDKKASEKENLEKMDDNTDKSKESNHSPTKVDNVKQTSQLEKSNSENVATDKIKEEELCENDTENETKKCENQQGAKKSNENVQDVISETVTLSEKNLLEETTAVNDIISLAEKTKDEKESTGECIKMESRPRVSKDVVKDNILNEDQTKSCSVDVFADSKDGDKTISAIKDSVTGIEPDYKLAGNNILDEAEKNKPTDKNGSLNLQKPKEVDSPESIEILNKESNKAVGDQAMDNNSFVKDMGKKGADANPEDLMNKNNAHSDDLSDVVKEKETEHKIASENAEPIIDKKNEHKSIENTSAQIAENVNTKDGQYENSKERDSLNDIKVDKEAVCKQGSASTDSEISCLNNSESIIPKDKTNEDADKSNQTLPEQLPDEEPDRHKQTMPEQSNDEEIDINKQTMPEQSENEIVKKKTFIDEKADKNKQIITSKDADESKQAISEQCCEETDENKQTMPEQSKCEETEKEKQAITDKDADKSKTASPEQHSDETAENKQTKPEQSESEETEKSKQIIIDKETDKKEPIMVNKDADKCTQAIPDEETDGNKQTITDKGAYESKQVIPEQYSGEAEKNKQTMPDQSENEETEEKKQIITNKYADQSKQTIPEQPSVEDTDKNGETMPIHSTDEEANKSKQTITSEDTDKNKQAMPEHISNEETEKNKHTLPVKSNDGDTDKNKEAMPSQSYDKDNEKSKHTFTDEETDKNKQTKPDKSTDEKTDKHKQTITEEHADKSKQTISEEVPVEKTDKSKQTLSEQSNDEETGKNKQAMQTLSEQSNNEETGKSKQAMPEHSTSPVDKVLETEMKKIDTTDKKKSVQSKSENLNEHDNPEKTDTLSCASEKKEVDKSDDVCDKKSGENKAAYGFGSRKRKQDQNVKTFESATEEDEKLEVPTSKETKRTRRTRNVKKTAVRTSKDVKECEQDMRDLEVESTKQEPEAEKTSAEKEEIGNKEKEAESSESESEEKTTTKMKGLVAQSRGRSKAKKRQADDSPEESPVEPVSKKSKGRTRVTSRGRGKRRGQTASHDSSESSSSSSDSDDIPLCQMAGRGRGGRSRGRGRRGGRGQRKPASPRPASRPAKKKKVNSDNDDDDDAPPAKFQAPPPKQVTPPPDPVLSEDDLGRRRSLRVRSMKARKKSPSPDFIPSELDLLEEDFDLDDDEEFTVKSKKRKKKEPKLVIEEIPKGRNALRHEAKTKKAPAKKGKAVVVVEEEVEEEEETPCCKCLKTDQPEWILLCDKCDSGYHTACLRPPLMIIPDGDWFCPPCEQNQLLAKLHENLKCLDQSILKYDRLVRRQERLAYVSISLDNVLKEPDEPVKKNKKEEESSSEETSSESDSQSGSLESESELSDYRQHRKHKSGMSKPRYIQRTCRAKNPISYRFEEYDELIMDAIEEDLSIPKEPKPKKVKPPGINRGKDMSNILGVSDEEAAPKKPQKKRRPRLTELDEDVDDDDTDDYEISNPSEASEQSKSSEESYMSEQESEDSVQRTSRYGARSRRNPSRRRGKRSSRYKDDFVVESDFESDYEVGRPTRRSRRTKVNYRELNSDETDAHNSDTESFHSSALDDSDFEDRRKKKTNAKEKKADRPRSGKRRIKRMSSSEESETEDDEDDRPVTKKGKKPPRKSARYDSEDESGTEESEEETKVIVKRKTRIKKSRVIDDESATEEEDTDVSGSSTEMSEDSERDKKMKKKKQQVLKKNVIRSDSEEDEDEKTDVEEAEKKALNVSKDSISMEESEEEDGEGDWEEIGAESDGEIEETRENLATADDKTEKFIGSPKGKKTSVKSPDVQKHDVEKDKKALEVLPEEVSKKADSVKERIDNEKQGELALPKTLPTKLEKKTDIEFTIGAEKAEKEITNEVASKKRVRKPKGRVNLSEAEPDVHADETPMKKKRGGKGRVEPVAVEIVKKNQKLVDNEPEESTNVPEKEKDLEVSVKKTDVEEAPSTERKDDSPLSVRNKQNAPVGVVKPEVRQGVIVENKQAVESRANENQRNQGENMVSPLQGMKDLAMGGQAGQGPAPPYQQNYPNTSMGGYMGPQGYQNYHQQAPYSGSGPGPYSGPHSGPQGPSNQAGPPGMGPGPHQQFPSHPGQGPISPNSYSHHNQYMGPHPMSQGHPPPGYYPNSYGQQIGPGGYGNFGPGNGPQSPNYQGSYHNYHPGPYPDPRQGPFPPNQQGPYQIGPQGQMMHPGQAPPSYHGMPYTYPHMPQARHPPGYSPQPPHSQGPVGSPNHPVRPMTRHATPNQPDTTLDQSPSPRSQGMTTGPRTAFMMDNILKAGPMAPERETEEPVEGNVDEVEDIVSYVSHMTNTSKDADA